MMFLIFMVTEYCAHLTLHCIIRFVYLACIHLFLSPQLTQLWRRVCWESRHRFVTQFFEYFVQLAYSCTHLFSDISHLLSTAPPSSRARTVDAWEVRGHMNSELYALHSTDVTREVRPVRRLLVNCCWFLVPVGRDVCSRPDEREHCC